MVSALDIDLHFGDNMKIRRVDHPFRHVAENPITPVKVIMFKSKNDINAQVFDIAAERERRREIADIHNSA